jgi:hypothetical protein
MKSKLLVTLFVSVLVIVGVGSMLYSLDIFDSASTNQPSIAPSTEPSSINHNQDKERAIPTEQAPIITKIDYTANELSAMYEASRLHNTCQQELVNLDYRQKVVRQRFNAALTKINDEKQWALAIMHMHELGIVSAQEAVSEINLNQLRRLRKSYEHHHSGTAPNDIQKAMMKNLQEISLALNTGDMKLLSESMQGFQTFSDKRGLLTRVRGENTLLSPHSLIGHAIATNLTINIDAILDIVPANHAMLNQAIRSEADTATISRLLASMDFSNMPEYTKTRDRQTPVQAAIESNNLDVLQLLLEQSTLSNVQFTFSPVNTILAQAMRSSDSAKLSDEQIEMLVLLRNFGHAAHLWPNEKLKKLQLMGYPMSIISDELREQMKALDIKAQVFQSLQSADPKMLDAETRAYFDETAQLLEQSQSQYADKESDCAPLKQAWKNQLPGLNVVVDITPFLKPGLNFDAQVAHLAQTSPTLVDIYYKESLKRPSNTDDIEVAINTVSDIRDDFSALSQALSSLDMDLFQRQFLVEKLCEEFDIEGVYASFSLARFIDYNNTTMGSCLFEIADYYGKLKKEFFAHPDTFPSAIVHELNNFSVEEATKILNELSSLEPKYTTGYPKGRDALMLALDMANSNWLSTDYRELITGLLAITELSTPHLRRLHRLKVVDILLFEDLASQFPEIEQATSQAFNIF